MAIRICPECGGKASDTRKECIHCGYIFEVDKETKICPECGGEVSKTRKECIHCGYVFDCEKEEKDKPILETVGPNSTSTKGTENKHLLKFYRITTKEEFLRKVFIELTRNENSPSDILTAEFGDVEEGEVQGFVIYSIVNGSYTASIGYDRQEQYTELENKYVREGDYYQYKGRTICATRTGSVTMDVVKTRTVTDWQPYSGNIINYKAAATVLEPWDKKFKRNLSALIRRSDVNSIHDEFEEKETIPEYLLSKGFEEIRLVTQYGISLPGDHSKDLRCNTSISEYEVYRCIVPTYKVTYVYKEKKYVVEGFAIKDDVSVAELPCEIEEIESEESLNQKQEQEIKTAEKKYTIAKMFGAVSLVSACLGMFFMYYTVVRIILLSLIGVSILAAIILAINASIVIKEIKKRYKVMISLLKKRKLIYLHKKLVEYGFDKLDKTEELMTGCKLSELINDDLSMGLDCDIINEKGTEKENEELLSNGEVKTESNKVSKLVLVFSIAGWLFILASFIQMLVSPGLDISWYGPLFGEKIEFHRYIYPSELIFGGGVSDVNHPFNITPIHSVQALIAWILTTISLALVTIALCMNFKQSKAIKGITNKLYFSTSFVSFFSGVLVLLMPIGVDINFGECSLYITAILSTVFLFIATLLTLVCAFIQIKQNQ